MDSPTATEIRTWSDVGFAERGYPEDDPDRLDVLITRAVAWFQKVTGRVLADITGDDESLTNEAVQMLVEWRVMRSQDEVIETAGDFDLIGNFSAAGYSETRRGDNRSANVLHPWPALNALLYQLLSDEKRSWAESMGIDAPDPTWDVGREILDANKTPASTPFGPYDPLWDGGS